jgi:hypothetical protein
MQSINTYVRIIIILLLIQLFYATSINASSIPIKPSITSSFSTNYLSHNYVIYSNKLPSPKEEHKHHLTDVESVDEEPTQQHQSPIKLIYIIDNIIIDAPIRMDAIFYPSPYFDITAPPPEISVIF